MVLVRLYKVHIRLCGSHLPFSQTRNYRSFLHRHSLVVLAPSHSSTDRLLPSMIADFSVVSDSDLQLESCRGIYYAFYQDCGRPHPQEETDEAKNM